MSKPQQDERRFIGIDINPEYCGIAEKRLATYWMERSVVTKKADPAQISMFEDYAEGS